MGIENKGELSIGKPLAFREVIVTCLLLLLISILSYGGFMARLGYYWDEWGLIYTQYFYGGKGFGKYITERPFDNYYYRFIIKFIGIKPIYWHLYIIFTRWVSGCLFYIFLRKAVPQLKSIAVYAALIYIVFPGFSGNSMSWVYSFMYVVISAVLLSLIFMREAITRRKNGGYFLALALAFEALHLLAIEYFVGVEIARAFIIYLMLYCIQAQSPKTFNYALFKKALWYSLPYLGVLFIYIICRAFVFHPVSLPETNQDLILHKFLANPVHGVTERLTNFITDFCSATVFLWTQCFSSDYFSVGAKIVFGAIFVSVLLFYLKSSKNKSEGNTVPLIPVKNLSLLLIFLGLVLIILGDIPVIVIMKVTVLGSHGVGDRYTLPEIFGSCLFITGVLHYFIADRRYLLYTFSLLTAAGGAYQFSVSRIFKGENDSLRNFYREMTWRMPTVEKGTYFLMESNPDVNFTSAAYSYSFAINGIYGSNKDMKFQNYWLTDFKDTRDTNPSSITPDVPVEFKFRSYGFKGNTSKSITLYYPEKGCLRVVDSANRKWTDADPFTNQASLLTKASLIKDTVEHKNDFLDKIYGHENKNCWCWYFEKMELAVQQNNWGKGLDFINAAIAKKLKPDNDVEWVTCLDIALHNGKYELANEIAGKDLETKLAKGYAYQLLSGLSAVDPQVKNQLINTINQSKTKNETSNH